MNIYFLDIFLSLRSDPYRRVASLLGTLELQIGPWVGNKDLQRTNEVLVNQYPLIEQSSGGTANVIGQPVQLMFPRLRRLFFSLCSPMSGNCGEASVMANFEALGMALWGEPRWRTPDFSASQLPRCCGQKQGF